MSRVRDRVGEWLSPWNRKRAFAPVPADGLLGFNLCSLDEAFVEACQRLDLSPKGTVNRGYGGRSRGTVVRRGDGTRCWLKVNGVYAPDNWYCAGEIEASQIR